MQHKKSQFQTKEIPSEILFIKQLMFLIRIGKVYTRSNVEGHTRSREERPRWGFMALNLIYVVKSYKIFYKKQYDSFWLLLILSLWLIFSLLWILPRGNLPCGKYTRYFLSILYRSNLFFIFCLLSQFSTQDSSQFRIIVLSFSMNQLLECSKKMTHHSVQIMTS